MWFLLWLSNKSLYVNPRVRTDSGGFHRHDTLRHARKEPISRPTWFICWHIFYMRFASRQTRSRRAARGLHDRAALTASGNTAARNMCPSAHGSVSVSGWNTGISEKYSPAPSTSIPPPLLVAILSGSPRRRSALLTSPTSTYSSLDLLAVGQQGFGGITATSWCGVWIRRER